jgi:hypothetical protein
MKQRYGDIDSIQRNASAQFARVHDGTGDNGLAMHRPGFRVSDAPPSDELRRAREDYLRDLTTAWRRGGKEVPVPDAPRAVGNDAEAVLDTETAYRLYAEEISRAQKAPR